MKLCLIIHGFTGSPFEVKPLKEALLEAGYQVETPVLAGHGEDDELMDVCWTDWVRSAEDSLKEVLAKHPAEDVIVIGFSMGSLIAAYLVTQYQVSKLVMLSPAIHLINYRQLFENMSAGLKHKLKDTESEDLKRYLEKATNTPIRSVMDFRRLTLHLTPSIKEVDVPTLIIHGEKDLLVKPKSAQEAFDDLKTKDKKLIFLPESPHILCHGEESDQVNQHVISFLSE